ncbi:NBPF family member NBPF12-like isoform 2-T2 [Erethizon dorsatum]
MLSSTTLGTGVTMKLSPSPLCHQRAEMTYFDISQDLSVQLEKSQQQLRDIKANLRITKATLYILATELRKCKSTRFQDVIDSVLGERLQPEEWELAEKLSLAEQLRESCILIQEQRRRLSQLSQKLEEGSSESLLLRDHLNAVLTRHEGGTTQGRDLRQQLAEGCRLAEHLAGKLSPENLERKSGEKHPSLLPRVSTEGEEKREEHVPQNSRGEGPETPSGYWELSDAQQPPCTPAVPVDAVSSSPHAAQPQDTLEPQEEEEAGVPRDLQDRENVDEFLEDSLDEKYLAFTPCQDPPASPEWPNIAASPANQNPYEDEDALEPEAPRTCCDIIQDNAWKLTQLHQQLRKGRDAAFSLRQSLQRLLIHIKTGYDASQGQGRQEELVEGCKLAEHLVLQLHTANSTNELDEEEKEPLYQPDDGGSDFDFLIQAQVHELTQSKKKLLEGRNVAFTLQENLRGLLSQDDLNECQGQSCCEKLVQWQELTERLTINLCPEHHCEGDGEEETQSLDSSVELCEEEVDDLLSEPVEELPFHGSGPPDAPHPQEHLVSAAVPADEPEASPAPDGTKAEHIGKPQEEEEASEVPRDFSSAIELEAQVWTHLGKTFRKWRDTIIFLRHRIRDLLSQKNPVRHKWQNHQDHAEWCKMAERLALQLGPELNLDPSLGLKNPPKVGDDATHGTQAHGLADAAAAQKQTILKRKPKPWLRLGKMACRFPRPRASGGEVPPAASNKDAAHLRRLVIRDRPALYSDI